MIHALNGAAVVLAQLRPEALQGDPTPLSDAPSEAIPLIIAAVLLIGIVAIAFRPAKRDRVEKP